MFHRALCALMYHCYAPIRTSAFCTRMSYPGPSRLSSHITSRACQQLHSLREPPITATHTPSPYSLSSACLVHVRMLERKEMEGGGVHREFVTKVSFVRPLQRMPMLHKAITVLLQQWDIPFGQAHKPRVDGRGGDAPIRADMKNMPRKLKRGRKLWRTEVVRGRGRGRCEGHGWVWRDKRRYGSRRKTDRRTRVCYYRSAAVQRRGCTCRCR